MTERPQSASDLSIIIPTRGRWATLRTTLGALERQTVRGFEVVVVVDGLDQDVPDLPGVRVLCQEHQGPGVARNHGVAECRRPLVLFLGDDMVPTRDLVAAHLAHHAASPEANVAVLGRAEWHPDVPRDRLHSWLSWSGALFDFPSAGTILDAGWQRFYSSNVSLKRTFFEAAGGFDPDFVFDYEDLDLGWRLGQRGLRLIFEPAALARHLHAYDWSRVLARYESRARAERLMMRKHDWFRPWFHDQVTVASQASAVWGGWRWLADAVPGRASTLRACVRGRADRHYLQHIAPVFLAAWDAAEVQEAIRESPSGSCPGGPK